MFRWLPFPFVRYLIFFIGGIITGNFIEISPQILMLSIMILFLGNLVYFLFKLRNFDNHGNYSAGLFFSLLFIGGLLKSYQSDHLSQTDHFHHYDSVNSIHGEIYDEPELKGRYLKFNFKITSINQNGKWKQSSGQLIVYLSYEGQSLPDLHYGDHLMISGKPFQPSPPKNPHEFDYQSFLFQQNLYAQMYVKPAMVLKTGHHSNFIKRISYRIRNYCSEQLKRFIQSPREQAIAMALILGNKGQLDFDTRQAFGSAGAMHVLAVSGLHVGIVYAVFQFLLAGFFNTKVGKVIVPLILISILWLYALITGFSPSVLRAVTMFSIIVIGNSMQRKANIYNSIFLSAFILLLANSRLIYSVGFQLSYLAVLSIVFFHPKIYGLVYVRNKWLDKIWSLTCVSLAAQIGTLPLTLYYFHQFPLLFFISNLVVIPGAFLILLGGFSLIASSGFVLLAKYVGQLLELLIYFQNEFVFYIHRLPVSKISGFAFSPVQCFILFLIIIIFIIFFQQRKFLYLVFIAVFVMTFGFLNLERMHQNKNQKRIVVYSIYKYPVIQFIAGNQAITEQTVELLESKQTFHIKPNQLYSSILKQSTANRLNKKLFQENVFYCWYGKCLAVIDKWPSRLSLDGKINVDFVIIRNPDQVDLQQMMSSLNFKILILDSSITKYQEIKIRKQLKHKIDFIHSINEDGYWEIKL